MIYRILTVLGFIGLCLYGGIRCVSYIDYKQECGGHLKRAADSNTIPLAEKELAQALQYIEKNDLTSGYTSVVYRTPDEDLEFWHSNLVAAHKELQSIAPNATQLEKTNVLMKLRETLLDSVQHGGQEVTAPEGISVYPHNTALVMLALVSLLMMLVFGFMWLADA